MWEISISFKEEKIKAAESFLKEIKKTFKSSGSVVTSYIENGYITAVLACDDLEKGRAVFFVSDAIAETVCANYKYDFINEKLKLPIKDKVNLGAFKKALVSFDKETDKYLVGRSLELKKHLNVDSFFEFKLRGLKNKWYELVGLANDNAAYLLASDTFIDLLKFLVDNLEICYDEVNIVQESNKFVILDHSYREVEENFSDFRESDEDIYLITSLIALCPKTINVYCDSYTNSSALTLISQIFDSRLHILPISLLKNKLEARQ